jgi:DNA-binding response OmpR family regulator
MAAAPSVLVIEDNHDIAQMVCDSLEQAGYVVDYAGDGVSGLHLAVSGSFDAIILDLMLPGMDGLELCRKLRRDAGKDTPVLMLTARDTLEDKIAGLDAGADDYLVKPFDLRELDARLRAMIRRFSGRMVDEVLSLGDLRVDTGTMEVERGGRRITLTPIAFTILLTLLKASPRIVARKAIDKPFPTPLLHTVAGRGYRLAVLDED